MAVAFDQSSESHTGTTGSTGQASFTWNHAPTGTPRGVLVFVFTELADADYVASVTYGGLALDRVSEARDTAGEPARVHAYYLGSGIGTGTRAVVVNRTNNATVMYAVCITVTAVRDTETTGYILLQDDGTFVEQQVYDGSISGTNSVRFAAAHSGGSSILPPGSNSSAVLAIDFGLYTATVVREAAAGQGLRPVGFAYATLDDRAAVHLAVREIPVFSAADRSLLLKGFIVGFGEDYQAAAKFAVALRAQWPSINWAAELRTVANAHQPFIDSGLSIDWWVDEVIRLTLAAES